MTDYRPIIFTWDGDHMVPLERFNHACNRQFVVHEQYRLVVEEERSEKAHRRYFACVREGWRNLPEFAPYMHDGKPVPLAAAFKNPEKLRKWVLILLGYADRNDIVCETDTDAVRFTELLGRLAQDSVVVRKGNVIQHFTAKSQSNRHMNKKEFYESSNAVLDYIATMIGTTVDQLAQNADQAA